MYKNAHIPLMHLLYTILNAICTKQQIQYRYNLTRTYTIYIYLYISSQIIVHRCPSIVHRIQLTTTASAHQFCVCKCNVNLNPLILQIIVLCLCFVQDTVQVVIYKMHHCLSYVIYESLILNFW